MFADRYYGKQVQVLMKNITIKWKRYPNFFDLWRAHKEDTKLIYIIGESHHCYIGSIGAKGGVGGIGNRYQWQYLNVSRAIFGRDESEGQFSHAGKFISPNDISKKLISTTEKFIQKQLIEVYGHEKVLFEPPNSVEDIMICHKEDVPEFLKKKMLLKKGAK